MGKLIQLKPQKDYLKTLLHLSLIQMKLGEVEKELAEDASTKGARECLSNSMAWIREAAEILQK